MSNEELITRLEKLQMKAGLDREERDALACALEIVRRIACSRAIMRHQEHVLRGPHKDVD